MEETFLEKLLEKMGRRETGVGPLVRSQEQQLDSIRQLLSNIKTIPSVVKPDGKRLQLDLSSLESVFGLEKVIVWLPLDWINSKSRTSFSRPFVTWNRGISIAGEWVGVDLTMAARRLLRHKMTSLLITGLNFPQSGHNTAFVEISTKEDINRDNSRMRRSSSQACETEDDSPCCLASVPLNLTDIGWDFIVSPRMIDFTYCRGHCDPSRLPANNFLTQSAQIRYKLHNRGIYSLPPPCCSPHHLEPITMLYIDGVDSEGGLILRQGTFHDMMPTQCGCG